MMNLIPEHRVNKNGVSVLRHVKNGDEVPNPKRRLPTPVLESRNALQTLSLKELDSGALTLALLSSVREMDKDGDVSHEAVLNALDKAAYLHRDQKRGNRKNLSETPYIEHPLRNALRAVRWGCKDEDILVAIILHDTVEDCADDIVRHSRGIDPDTLTEQEKRDISMEWVESEFGSEVARLVLAVSNPISENRTLTAREKREEYADHVGTAIEDDAAVFLVKIADFVDNASGLHHNDVEGNHEKVQARARKYLLVVSTFQKELESNEAIRDLIDEDGYRDIVKQLERTAKRLATLAK